MPNRDRLQSIYLAASSLPGDEVSGYLETACAGDPDLRQQVERLLSAKAALPGLLAEPTAETLASDRSAALPAGVQREVGSYRLLEVLGEGAFGVVYLAEQRAPIVRRVALKMLHREHADPKVLARFEAERQALALMEHPHIAKFLEAGADESGRPFFAMELVTGEPIDVYCNNAGLSIRERVEMLEQVCHAAHHAHTKGIIHRDLKPSNVLVSRRDGAAHAMVIDFGIAKALQMRLTDRTLHTAGRSLIGTPEYMSPEQINGSRDIDTRTDIYSLGVMLYKLISGFTTCGASGLQDASLVELIRHIRETDPPRPSSAVARALGSDDQALIDRVRSAAKARSLAPKQFVRTLQGELDVIALKALEREPSRRYQSASEFAMDLRRYLLDQPIAAGQHTALYWISKAVRRHRPAIAVALLFVVSLAALSVVASAGWMQALERGEFLEDAVAEVQSGNERLEDALREKERQAALAESRRHEAIAHAELAEFQSARANVLRASSAMDASMTGPMRDALNETSERYRNWEWDYLQAWADRSVMLIRGHQSPVLDVVFIDGAHRAASLSVDGIVRLIDIAAGRIIREVTQPSIRAVAIAADPSTGRVIVASADGSVRLFETRSSTPGRLVLDARASEMTSRGPIRFLDWDGESATAAAAYDSGTVILFSTDDDSGREEGVRQLSAFRSRISALAIEPSGARVAVAGAGGGLRIYDPRSAELLRSIETHPGSSVDEAAFTQTGRLAVVDDDGYVQLIDLNDTTGAAWGFQLGGRGDHALTVSPNGRMIAVASEAGVSVLDSSGSGLRMVTAYLGHERPPVSIEYAAESGVLLTGSLDQTVRLWDPRDSDDRLRVPGTRRWSGGEVSPDGSAIAIARDGVVVVRDLRTAEIISRLESAGMPVHSASFAPDGKHVIARNHAPGSEWHGDGAVFDVLSGQMVARLRDLRNMSPITSGVNLVNEFGYLAVSGVVYGPHGRRVAVNNPAGGVVVFDWRSGTQAFVLGGHGSDVALVAFDPSGSRIVTAESKGPARIWSAVDGTLLWELPESRAVHAIRFSTDGRLLATLAEGGVLTVWDSEAETTVSSAQTRIDAQLFNDALVHLTNDGYRVFARSVDGIDVLLPSTGETLSRMVLEDPRAPSAFSQYADRMATVSRSGRVQIWDTERGMLMLTVRGWDHAPRFLSFADSDSMLVSGGPRWVELWDTRDANQRVGDILDFEVRRSRAESRIRVLTARGLLDTQVYGEDFVDARLSDLDTRALASALHTVRSESEAGQTMHAEEADELALAVSRARREVELSAHAPESLTRYGIALYRNGDHEQALDALQRSERTRADAHLGDPDRPEFWEPENGAYIAMSLWRLDRRADAREAIGALRRTIEAHHIECDCDRHLAAALSVITGDDQPRGSEQQ